MPTYVLPIRMPIVLVYADRYVYLPMTSADVGILYLRHYRLACQKIFSYLKMWGTSRGRGEQLETLWAWLKGRVAFVTRYRTPAHRAGFIKLVVQNHNHQLVSSSALQLYSMARHSLASLHYAREDVNKLYAIVSKVPALEVCVVVFI